MSAALLSRDYNTFRHISGIEDQRWRYSPMRVHQENMKMMKFFGLFFLSLATLGGGAGTLAYGVIEENNGAIAGGTLLLITGVAFGILSIKVCTTPVPLDLETTP